MGGDHEDLIQVHHSDVTVAMDTLAKHNTLPSQVNECH